MTLTYAGAAVWAVASAREALTAMDDVTALDDIDVVITDYPMPGHTGLWLLDRATRACGPCR